MATQRDNVVVEINNLPSGWFYLPYGSMDSASLVPARDDPSDPEASSGWVNSLHKAKILCLEDDANLADILVSQVHRWNIETTLATTYKEFVDRLRADRFDAVSIDWELQGKIQKGGEALDLIREHYPWMTRIVYTYHRLRFQDAREQAADAFFLKSSGPGKGSPVEYGFIMHRAARIGIVRSIWSILVSITELSENCPHLPAQGWPSDATDLEYNIAKLALSAISSGIRQKVSPRVFEDLINHMTRIGWWRAPEYIVLGQKTDHLDQDILQSCITGELNRIQQEIVLTHLRQCAICRGTAVNAVDANPKFDQHQKVFVRNLIGIVPIKVQQWEGSVEKILPDDQQAYVRLINSEGRVGKTQYDAIRLLAAGIKEGDDFLCILQEREGQPELVFQRVDLSKRTNEEWDDAIAVRQREFDED